MTTLDIINEILFWLLWALLLWQSYIILFNKGIPNIKTAPAIRDFVIKTLASDHETKGKHGPYFIYELGSGNGKLSREMAHALSSAQIIGIEISKLAYWRSLLIRKITKQENLTHLNSNFMSVDLSPADAIYIYQLPSVMAQLRDKFKNELKPGTIIICNKFPLGGDWTPQHVIDIQTMMPHQKTIYIYRT